MLNLHVKMLRDAENAKFGLKAHGKASSSKENEVMVFLYAGYHRIISNSCEEKMIKSIKAFILGFGSLIHCDAISAFHFRGHQVVLGNRPAWTSTKASLLFLSSFCNDSTV